MAPHIPVSFADVLHAVKRIESFIHKTPCFTSATINKHTGRNIYFKAENLQKTGSFKIRGALNAILSLKEQSTVKGIVTHSSGNHGLAVAYASKLTELPCSVVVPKTTPAVKMEAIKSYGANLVLCEPTPVARFSMCQKISDEQGLAIIPPYDHYDVIAGQGSIAVELLEQVPELDAILVAVSGGGMTSGITIAAKAIKPQIKVFMVEPEGKILEQCLKAGERLWPNPPVLLRTDADGLLTQQLGTITWPIILTLTEKEVFTTTDNEMIEGMKIVFERMKLVIEAAAGAAVAAVMSDRMRGMEASLKHVGVILCGGNIDINNLPWY